jgi:hypothetical protein
LSTRRKSSRFRTRLKQTSHVHRWYRRALCHAGFGKNSGRHPRQPSARAVTRRGWPPSSGTTWSRRPGAAMTAWWSGARLSRARHLSLLCPRTSTSLRSSSVRRSGAFTRPRGARSRIAAAPLPGTQPGVAPLAGQRQCREGKKRRHRARCVAKARGRSIDLAMTAPCTHPSHCNQRVKIPIAAISKNSLAMGCGNADLSCCNRGATVRAGRQPRVITISRADTLNGK